MCSYLIIRFSFSSVILGHLYQKIFCHQYIYLEFKLITYLASFFSQKFS